MLGRLFHFDFITTADDDEKGDQQSSFSLKWQVDDLITFRCHQFAVCYLPNVKCSSVWLSVPSVSVCHPISTISTAEKSWVNENEWMNRWMAEWPACSWMAKNERERENWSANGHKPYAVWDAVIEKGEKEIAAAVHSDWLTDHSEWSLPPRLLKYVCLKGKKETTAPSLLWIFIYLFPPFPVLLNLVCLSEPSLLFSSSPAQSSIWWIESECKLISSRQRQRQQPNEVTAPFYYYYSCLLFTAS